MGKIERGGTLPGPLNDTVVAFVREAAEIAAREAEGCRHRGGGEVSAL